MKTYPAEQFHARRLEGIGGSDIGAIMGHNPFRSKLDVYQEKIDQTVIDDNFAMRFGRTMEVTLREAYQELHDLKITCSTDTDLMIFESNNGLLPFYYHPDGVIGFSIMDETDGYLWEAKSSSRYSAWKNGLPPEVVDQCQWGLMLSGLSKCVVSLGLGAREYREFEIMPDKDHQECMAATALMFWNDHVLKKVPPDPSGSESDRVWLDEAFDESETVAPLTMELVELATRRIELDNAESCAARHKAEVDQLIMKALGDHSRAAGDNFKVTWKRPNARKTLDKIILREVLLLDHTSDEADGIIEHSMKTSEQKRRFTFKEVADGTS